MNVTKMVAYLCAMDAVTSDLLNLEVTSDIINLKLWYCF